MWPEQQRKTNHAYAIGEIALDDNSLANRGQRLTGSIFGVLEDYIEPLWLSNRRSEISRNEAKRTQSPSETGRYTEATRCDMSTGRRSRRCVGVKQAERRL